MAPPVATVDSPPRSELATRAPTEASSGVDPIDGSGTASVTGRGPGLEVVFTVLFALAGWWVGIRQLADNSFFWHLRTGQYILDHGIPRGDIFSYTAPGSRWVAQSWLAEIAYGALDRTVGDLGIRLLIAVTGGLITVLSYRLARRITGDRLRAGMIAVVGYLATMVVYSERPLAFGLLAAIVVVWIVEFPESRIGRRPLLWLPIVFWLWANVHGSFALGVVFIALHLLGRALDGAKPWEGRERQLAIGTLVGVLVSLVNPYGTSLLLFPIQLMGRGQVLSQIVEWRSPDFRSPIGIAFACWIVVLVAGLALAERRPSRRDVLVAIPFVLLALWAERNIGLAVLFTLPIASRAFATTRQRADSRTPAAAVALIVVLSLFGLSGVSAASQPNFQMQGYPVKAMTYMQQHGLIGERLFTTDSWAGYTILRFWPQQRIFLDDRYDMFPEKIINDYTDVADGHPDWSKVLDEYHVQVIVWAPDRALTQLLAESPHWKRVHADRKADVFVRVGASS